MSTLRRIGSEWGMAFLLLVALVSYFLDWHVVHETNVLEGFSLTGPSLPAPPLRDTGAHFTCTGFSHYRGSLVIPGLLSALLLFTLLTRRRQGLLVLVIQLAVSAATVAYAISSQLLAHLFERVETLLPENLFVVALLSALAVSLLRALYASLILVRRPTATS